MVRQGNTLSPLCSLPKIRNRPSCSGPPKSNRRSQRKEAELALSVSHILPETLVQPRLSRCHLRQRPKLGKATRQSVADMKARGSGLNQHLLRIEGLPWLLPKPRDLPLKTLDQELMKQAAASLLTQKATLGANLAWTRESLTIETTATILQNSISR